MTGKSGNRSCGVSEAGFALTCYCLSSIAMTILNKLVLSRHRFGMNMFLLLVQSTVCVIALQIFRMLGLLTFRPMNLRDAKAWFPVSLLLVAMIFSNSKRYVRGPTNFEPCEC
jgi:GDP-mannose transporter